MSDEPIQLSDSEHEESLALLASIDLDVPEEWNGSDRSALVKKIPGSNVEMRYNIRPAYDTEDAFYHYWTVLAGDYGRMLIVRSQELTDSEAVGFNIERDEESGEIYRHDMWSYGFTDLAHTLSVDAADAINIARLVPESEQVRENLDALLAQWLTYDGIPDTMWSFILTTLYAEMVDDLMAPKVVESPDTTVTP